MKIETFADEADFIVQRPQSRYSLGLFGLIVAIVGLALAIARPYIADALKPPPEPKQKLSDKLAEAGEKFVDRMIAKVRRKPAAAMAQPPPPVQPPERPWSLYFGIAASALGFVGSLAGVAGWIRHEPPRMAYSAISVGVIAVGWVYIVAALVIALVIFFLLLLFGALG